LMGGPTSWMEQCDAAHVVREFWAKK